MKWKLYYVWWAAMEDADRDALEFMVRRTGGSIVLIGQREGNGQRIGALVKTSFDVMRWAIPIDYFFPVEDKYHLHDIMSTSMKHSCLEGLPF